MQFVTYLFDLIAYYNLASAVGHGRASRPDHNQQHHAPTVKPEAATAAVQLLMMGVRMPETR
jgi:hypothetical protein